jgi:2-polyprenyl-3-methyl-5-hydroxy-6-metoxy-1,4-benzoquinol methylase
MRLKNMANFNYSGSELDVFSRAMNWKHYWSNKINKYLGDSVLEVGAGIGSNTEILSNKGFLRWVVIEPDINFCSIIDAKIKSKILPKNIEIINTTLSKLDKGEYFDTILYIDVLEHIENDIEELRNAQAHLAQNGHIIVVAPAHNFLFTPFDKKIGHFRRYNKGMFRAITPSNCTIVDLRYLDSIVMLASIANKLFFKSHTPTISQVLFWDKYMVRISSVLDGFFAYLFGKSVIYILEKK